MQTIVLMAPALKLKFNNLKNNKKKENMEFIKKLAPKPEVKNTYKIVMKTYWGDADGYETYKFLVPEADIYKATLETIVLKALPDFGWRRSEGSGKDYLMEEGAAHNKFDWLEDYPYNHDIERINTLDSYKIYYFDNEAKRYSVESVGFEEFTKQIKEFNKSYYIANNNNNVGANNSFSSGYREGIYALIDKALLELNLDKTIELSNGNKLKI